MTPRIFSGYQFDVTRAAEAAARGQSEGSDIARFGPVLRRQSLERLRTFCELAPISTKSRARSVVVDGRQLGSRVQAALLKLVEEPPETCQILITCETLGQLLPTIQSRCLIQEYGTPSFGTLVRDLTTGGLSLTSAPEVASWMMRGRSRDLVPDQQSFIAARNLLSFGKLGEVESGLRIANELDERAVVALRLELIESGDVKGFIRTFKPVRPENVGLLLFADNFKRG